MSDLSSVPTLTQAVPSAESRSGTRSKTHNTNKIHNSATFVAKISLAKEDTYMDDFPVHTPTCPYEMEIWQPPPHHFLSERQSCRQQSHRIRISNVRLLVPCKVILPRETSPLVRTPLHAAEELVRFGRLVDFFVSLQIFGSDEALAAVYADAISWAVPASMVAVRV